MTPILDSLPNYLPGQTPDYGIKQQAPQYPQGVDIVITACLTEDGNPVNYNDYSLIVALKADLSSPFTVWQGYLNYGLIVVNNALQINIPAHVSKRIPPGIFYISILGKSKSDISHYAILFDQTISIQPSATSPLYSVDYSLMSIDNQNCPVTPGQPNPTINVPIEYFGV